MTMKIKKEKEQKISNYTPQIRSEFRLYFGFHALSNCNDSQKVLEKNNNHKKKFLNALLELTKFFEGKNSHTLDIKGETAPKEYKKLKGDGIEGHSHKFKLDGATSVLVDEQPESNKLLINIRKVGDFH